MAKETSLGRLPTLMHTEDDFQNCATRLKALADPDRLRIVACLLEGPKNVSDLATQLGEDLVKISHHLSVLRHANVVCTKKQGKFVIYSLDPEITSASQGSGELGALNLGCCRLDLSVPPADPAD